MKPTDPAGPKSSTATRIAVFGSFYRGFFVLSELLSGPISAQVEVVGVATDDPGKSYVSPGRRVWQYPHSTAEEEMVGGLAAKAGIDVFSGKVKSAEFYELIEQKWRPALCIMATFGQRIDERLYTLPPLGFFNLHPCIDDRWPSAYAGPNPFQALLDDQADHVRVAMHRVDGGFDTGELIGYSEKLFIPKHASVVDLHKMTSPLAAKLAAAEIEKIIEASAQLQAAARDSAGIAVGPASG
jgi:methionyl-tRNA formyltransferase